jgi:FkbM family methyltransferase
MGHRIAGVWHEEPGDFQLHGLWYPDGDELTKYMIARLQTEPFYRSDKLLSALAHVKQFRGAVDCGAWVGAWSRALSGRFKHVVGIEMHPDNARCAMKNCPLPNVTIANLALGDTNRKATLQKSQYGGTIESWVASGDSVGKPIAMMRLDNVAAVQEMGPIDYLKVHVNGSELNVLRGATRTIERNRPVITVVIKRALAEFGHKPEEIFAFMRGIGYVVAGGPKPYWTFIPR